MDTLDVTGFKESGVALKKAIQRAAKDTQSVIIQPYPHIIRMTKDQFDILQHDPEMRGMYQSNEHLYWTPDCIMEVQIKE
jgi:hypothetical protein